MGGETTTTTQQTQAQPTAEETELNKLSLERARAAQGGLLQGQESGLNLINTLLTGGQLPGNLAQLSGGISPEAIGFQATDLAKRNLAGFQSLGLADSGVAFRETSEDIANQLLFPAEQFNIGSLQNLLTSALTGQQAVQQPILGSQSQLGQRLAGLRSTTGTSTQTSPNPFLQSFQRSLGQSLGSGSFGGFTAFE